MRKSVKFALYSIVSLGACFFFLSWAMQTVWQASFPGQGTMQSGLHFYLQLSVAFLFLVFAVFFGWKWYRSR